MTVEKCSLCGEEYYRRDMIEMFTGRMKYICPSCYTSGCTEIAKKRQAFRSSARGKQVIEQARKKSTRK